MIGYTQMYLETDSNVDAQKSVFIEGIGMQTLCCFVTSCMTIQHKTDYLLLL